MAERNWVEFHVILKNSFLWVPHICNTNVKPNILCEWYLHTFWFIRHAPFCLTWYTKPVVSFLMRVLDWSWNQKSFTGYFFHSGPLAPSPVIINEAILAWINTTVRIIKCLIMPNHTPRVSLFLGKNASEYILSRHYPFQREHCLLVYLCWGGNGMIGCNYAVVVLMMKVCPCVMLPCRINYISKRHASYRFVVREIK